MHEPSVDHKHQARSNAQRLFLSINPGVEDILLTAKLQSETRRMSKQMAAASARVRWCDQASFHLTLVFLGMVSTDDSLRVQECVSSKLTMMPFPSILLDGLGCFPGVRPARVVWVRVRRTPELMEAQRILAEALTAYLPASAHQEGYFPHVTLARLTRGTHSPDAQKLAGELDYIWHDWIARHEVIAWRQPRLALMRSEPGKNGAYSQVASFPWRTTRAELHPLNHE